jgi:hypothetical protein
MKNTQKCSNKTDPKSLEKEQLTPNPGSAKMDVHVSVHFQYSGTVFLFNPNWPVPCTEVEH